MEQVSFWEQFKRNKKGIIGLGLLLILIFISIFSNYLAPYDPYEAMIAPQFSPPSSEHILGGNDVGMDIFSELLYAGKVSLFIGILASFTTSIIGTLVGIISGYFGGTIDNVLMGITDIFLTLPSFPLMILLSSYLGCSIFNLIVVISLLGWLSLARQVRAQVLSVKEQPFIEASRSLQPTSWHIIVNHILPNCVGVIYANTVIGIVHAILLESSLSFLGLGDPIIKSWGMIMHYAQKMGGFSRGMWWWWLPPGLLIAVSGVAFLFVGETINDILNPRKRII